MEWARKRLAERSTAAGLAAVLTAGAAALTGEMTASAAALQALMGVMAVVAPTGAGRAR